MACFSKLFIIVILAVSMANSVQVCTHERKKSDKLECAQWEKSRLVSANSKRAFMEDIED